MKQLEKSFQKIMKIVNRKDNDKLFENIAKKAVDNSLKKYPDGAIITKKMIGEFASEVAKEFAPIIARNIERKTELSKKQEL